VQGNLDHVAEAARERAEALLALAAKHPTPFYAFDTQGLDAALARFKHTFDAALPGHKPYYAVKSNDHPWVLAAAVRAGYGLDVSSARELGLALDAGADAILFSGPAKSEHDLTLCLRHRARVIVNMDSFGELEKLGALCKQKRTTLRAGVRVYTRHHGTWSKFGIPLAELGKFFRAAARHRELDLCGIQMHLSWNRSAEPYARIVAELGRAIAKQLGPKERDQIRFVDVGGGYKPHALEGYFPRDHALGMVAAAVDEAQGTSTAFTLPFIQKDSVPLQEYADTLAAAVKKHLVPLVPAVYFSEPGRIVSTWAMHLVMRVADVKKKDLVILDGGIHMVGWERYLHIYAPVVNLSQPARRTRKVRMFGSLCDPEDSFGELCYARGMAEGDVIVVPFQGAYTWTVAQDFIRDVPPVHKLGRYAARVPIFR
jgi:diaminopimelate decarboxylase